VREPYPALFPVDVLPDAVAAALAALPLTPANIEDTGGRRETHNATRIFLAGDMLRRFPVCADVAAAFQDAAIVDTIESVCGVDLEGSRLRIEYCLDTNGFWLEPHTDIGAKLLTMLIYLSDPPPGEDWGTDIYDAEKRPVATAPAAFNTAMVFVPGANTWHGFRRRPITGVRRSLIVNYVKNEWRSRHELAFPDRPVSSRRVADA